MTDEEMETFIKEGGGSYEANLESMDTAKKLAYGAEQERFIFPLLATHAEAAYDHLFTEDMTYGESLRSQEDERQEEVLKKFPEMQGVRMEDEDGTILAGRIGSAFVDPVSWLIPWTKLGKAATLTGTAVKSGLWGGAIAGTESAARETAMYGVEDASGTVIAASTAIGAVAPAALGAVSYKFFPKQFQDEIADLETNPDKLKATVVEEDLAPNLKPDEVADVERATEAVVSPSVVSSSSEDIANLHQELKVTNGLSVAIKNLESFKQNYKKGSELHNRVTKQLKSLKSKKTRLENKTLRGTLEKYLPEKAKSTVEVLEKLKSEGKLTNKIMTTVLHEATRPIVGGIGGLAYGGILGDEYDDTILFSSIAAGATVGFLSRRLETSNLLTDLDMKTGKLILQDSAFSNFRSNMKILTAGTTSTRLEAFGGWNKLIGSMLFGKFGSATDSVETRTIRNQSIFLGEHAKILDKSFDDEAVNNAVGEVMRGYTKLEDLSVGYSGLTKKYSALTQEQIDEVKRITPELSKLVDQMADRMNAVGIQFNRIDNYGLPQLWDLNFIEKDPLKFVEDLKEAIAIQVKNQGKDKGFFSANQFHENIAGGGTPSKTGYSHPRSKFEIDDDGEITWRGTAQFFENERRLTDLEATKFMAERGWLDINAGRAVGNYGLNSIKVADFAEVFGADGKVINEALTQIRAAFKDRPDLAQRHESYRDSLINAVEGYWGVYGANKSKGANNFMRLATSLANMSYLTTVTIANMGDLLQPFVNSGFGTAAKTLATRTVSPSSRKFSKLSHFKYDQSWEREYSAMITKNVNPFNRKKDFIEWSNQIFFKGIGLQTITGVARNFAYDVGVNNAFKMAQKATPNSERALARMEQLGLSIEDLNQIKKYNNIEDAFESEDVGKILDKAGRKAADRDAIIPTVGNRLLFTQTANPYIRPLGQFLSWAQAKSAQTNALIKRVEDGDMKLALTSLATVPLYMGVQTLKEWANPEFRAGEKPLTIEDDWVAGLGKALSLSGNYSNWAIDKFIGSIRSMNYGEGALESASPAVSFLVDAGYKLPKDAWKDLAAGDTEGAIREVGERVPVVSIAANVAERVLDAPIIIDREEKNTGGILGEEVPNTTQEPEERMDKVTGVPYDVQAGGSNVDVVERSPTLLATLMKRQQQKEQPELGGNLLDRLKRRMENVA